MVNSRARTLVYLLFLSYLFLIFPGVLAASENNIGTTRVSFTTGSLSQTENIEDRDLAGYYDFYKYALKVKGEPEKGFKCNAGYIHYIKDFDPKNDDLDTIIDILTAGFSIPAGKAGPTEYTIGADYTLRAKRYRNSPDLEYDNNRLSVDLDLRHDKNYCLGLSTGINNYEYLEDHSSDQNKTFIKIAPSFKSPNEKIDVSSFYKRTWVEQADSLKDYSEDDFSVSPSYLLDTPVLYKLGSKFGYGRSDTRETGEDREDNLRFEYKLWDVTGYFKLRENVETDLTYGQTYRDYFTSPDSYDNWYIKDKTTMDIYKKDDLSTSMIVGAEHKETHFYEDDTLSYKKNAVSVDILHTKRAAYSLNPFFTFTKYSYPSGSTNSEDSYKAGFNLKKYIDGTDNAFEAGYFYNWKDYKYKADVSRWMANVAYTRKF